MTGRVFEKDGTAVLGRSCVTPERSRSLRAAPGAFGMALGGVMRDVRPLPLAETGYYVCRQHAPPEV